MIQLNNDFASKALNSFENGDLEKPTRQRLTISSSSTNNTKRSALLKRSRSRPAISGSISSSFDMGDFLKASQQVEDTLAFPTIEWPSFDDDDSSSDDDNSYSVASSLTRPREDIDDDEDEDYFQNPRKRTCRGLTRCDRSCNLTSLWEIATLSERCGSNGSLS